MSTGLSALHFRHEPDYSGEKPASLTARHVRGVYAAALSAAPVFVIGVFATLELFSGLGVSNLRDWDEAIFAQAAKEMLRSGDWVVLHFQHGPWFDKPPLFVWSITFLYHIFGVTEFWSRASSALSGVALILVVFSLGTRLYGRLTGSLACLVLLSGEAFVRSARLAMSDTLLTLCIYAAVYGYVRVAEGRAAWWWLVWVACAGAIMTKWVAAFPAFVGVGGAVLLDRRGREALRSKPFWYALAAAVLITAPWHLYMYGRYGTAFLHRYVGVNLVVRATTALEGNAGGPRFYVEQLGSQFAPWSQLLPFAVARNLRDAIRGDGRARLLLLVFGSAFVVCLTLTTKLPWYLVPLLPGFALAIAVILADAWTIPSSYEWAALVFVAVLLWVTSSLPAGVKLAGVAAAGSVAALPLLLGWGPRRQRAAATALIGVLVLIGGDRVKGLFRTERRPVAALARIARRPPGRAADTLFLGPGLNGPSAVFYSDRPVAYAGAVQRLTEPRPAGYREAILARSDVEMLARHCRLRSLAESEGYAYVQIEPGCE